mmetsp:Transcript_1099/g.2291  ORF Transcript_1099/g.2291 Transcript_1099/m.2291 type:complete len:223 (+) Transcript_1099:932-1600(+)
MPGDDFCCTEEPIDFDNGFVFPQVDIQTHGDFEFHPGICFRILLPPSHLTLQAQVLLLLVVVSTSSNAHPLFFSISSFVFPSPSTATQRTSEGPVPSRRVSPLPLAVCFAVPPAVGALSKATGAPPLPDSEGSPRHPPRFPTEGLGEPASFGAGLHSALECYLGPYWACANEGGSPPRQFGSESFATVHQSNKQPQRRRKVRQAPPRIPPASSSEACPRKRS